jgi:cytochrome c
MLHRDDFAVAVVLTLQLVIAEPFLARAQSAPPDHGMAAQVEELVNRASDLLENQGSRAFSGFRARGGPWRMGDTYLFVIDMNGVVLLNVAYPNREGRDLLEERDSDGNQFHKKFIHVAKKYGAGWVDYMFPKPGQHLPSLKWSYVCRTTVDGVDAVVGAGVYLE